MFFVDWPQVRLQATLKDHPGLVLIGESNDFPDPAKLEDEAAWNGLRIVMAGGGVFAVHPIRFKV